MVYTDELDEIRRKIIDVADREDTNVKAVIEDVAGGRIDFTPGFDAYYHCNCTASGCGAKISVRGRTVGDVALSYSNRETAVAISLSPADAKRLAARLLRLTEQ